MSSKYRRYHPQNWTGVYVYELKTTFQGACDLCFMINYRQGRTLIWEKIGKRSEGCTADTAAKIRKLRLQSVQQGKLEPTKERSAPIQKGQKGENASLHSVDQVMNNQAKVDAVNVKNPEMHKTHPREGSSVLSDCADRYLQMGTKQHWKAGAIVPRPQQQGAGFYMVVDGLVKIFGYATSGERKVLLSQTKGDFVYDMYFFMGVPAFTVAEAIEESETIFLRRETILRLIDEDIKFLSLALHNNMKRTYIISQDLVDVCRTNPAIYLLHILRSLAKREKVEPNKPVAIRVTQDELSDLMGVHRITVNRWLRKLAEEGHVSVSRGLILLTPQACS